MDYSPPGSSVHGISQARMLEWVAIFFSRVFSLIGYHEILSRVPCVIQVLVGYFFYI